ncbi:primosomal protein N' [Pseudomonas stutzeri]|nr:primosomal protein N' [Stutzerimonas stutzeri]
MPHIDVAVFCPLDQTFTYEWPESLGEMPSPGCRVKVPFGKRTVTGLVVRPTLAAPSEEAAKKIRPVEELIDRDPLWDSQSWATWLWMADYYQHPIGDALATTLPAGLAKGGQPEPAKGRLLDMSGDTRYAAGDMAAATTSSQKAVMRAAAAHADGVTRLALIEETEAPRVVDLLIRTGALQPVRGGHQRHALNAAQSEAAGQIKDSLNGFSVTLLDGVTGSGKTEVYMEAIEEVIAQGKQVLYLVPEIGLTPQTCGRLEQRFEVCVLHSKLSEKDRLLAWELARTGAVSVIVGTRSALFTPMPNLGLIVIDEEHDSSFKQDTHLRYHARDVAIYLGNKRGVPVVLGSATPSAESYRNATAGRYRHLQLTERATGAQMPKMEVIDAKSLPHPDGISQPALHAIRRTLAAGGQALVYLPRRGFSHALFCTTCGWASECPNCSARMVFHRGRGKLICHHCTESSHQPGACPKCLAEVIPLGAGTERAEAALSEALGEDYVLRLDTDVLSSTTAMHEAFNRIRKGDPLCIVGTQLLAKGHDFPNVTLVVVTGTDSALFSADARASERVIQQITQVAGRSGRSKPGRVLIQTSQAENPVIQQLINEGYHATLAGLVKAYEETMLPPVCAHALLTVETTDRDEGRLLLEQVIDRIDDPALVGPFPAIMERRAGSHRYQAVVLAESRKERHTLLKRMRQEWKTLGTRYPLMIDVDPSQLS